LFFPFCGYLLVRFLSKSAFKDKVHSKGVRYLTYSVLFIAGVIGAFFLIPFLLYAFLFLIVIFGNLTGW
jgi:hypothetical protein